MFLAEKIEKYTLEFALDRIRQAYATGMFILWWHSKECCKKLPCIYIYIGFMSFLHNCCCAWRYFFLTNSLAVMYLFKCFWVTITSIFGSSNRYKFFVLNVIILYISALKIKILLVPVSYHSNANLGSQVTFCGGCKIIAFILLWFN